MKACTCCTLTKPSTEFFKRGDSNAYRSHCKACCTNAKLARDRKNGVKPRTKMSVEEKRESLRRACAKHNKTLGRKIKQAKTEANRRAQKLMASPKWLTPDQLFHIQIHYEMAAYLTKTTGEQWDVDHIVPLKGKNVKGLHVPWNLQIMSHTQNQVKSNKYV